MHTILGIDQSYKSAGICVLNDLGEPIEMFTIKTDKTQGDVFYRSHKIAERIAEIVNHHAPVCIGLEGLAFAKFGDATRDLAGLQFTIVNTLRFKLLYDNIVIPSPNEVKKIATGKGNADKSLLFESLPADVKSRLEKANYKKTTGLFDITDAYWIAQYALRSYKLQIDN